LILACAAVCADADVRGRAASAAVSVARAQSFFMTSLLSFEGRDYDRFFSVADCIEYDIRFGSGRWTQS
jgi:hypothetical protein